MITLQRFALWTALVALAALWRDRCEMGAIDLRRTTATCVKLAADPPGSSECHTPLHPPLALCLPPHRALELSPAALARTLGDLGPLLVWAPLLGASVLTYHPHGAHHHRPHVRRAVALAAAVYLSAIMPVRYLRRALPSGFDPSGHILLFGVQLVPLWAAAEVAVHAPAPALAAAAGGRAQGRWWCATARAAAVGLGAAEVALFGLSVSTAAWFHSGWEVAASWAVVAALAWGTHARLATARAQQQQAPQQPEQQLHPRAQSPGDGALGNRGLHAWWVRAVAAWVAGLCLPLWLLAAQPAGGGLRTGPLVGAVVYDAAVAALAWWLLHPPHNRGGATNDGAAPQPTGGHCGGSAEPSEAHEPPAPAPAATEDGSSGRARKES